MTIKEKMVIASMTPDFALGKWGSDRSRDADRSPNLPFSKREACTILKL
jgi:hypothetical protein